jgi:mono/diheme cytochrome c family protein
MMRWKIVNVLLLVTTVAILSLNFILRADSGMRNFEVFPDMAVAPAYDSYAVNPNFADGKTLREPVAGTIIRGQMPLGFEATKEDAERAGRELVNPFSGDAGVLERGSVVYARYCLNCHGPEGRGDGVVATRGFPAPPPLQAPNALGLRDGQMFHIVTYGQGNMPSHAAQIDRDDRWRAIEYVRKLQGVTR